MAQTSRSGGSVLNQLASRQFSELSPTEVRLLDALLTTGSFVCPASEAKGSIRADLLRWICITPDAIKQIGPTGLELHGVAVVGLLDLSFVNFHFPLSFIGCTFDGRINLQNANLKRLNMSGSAVREIFASGVRVDDDVLMGGLCADGPLVFSGARIGGSFNFDRAKLMQEPDAIVAAEPNKGDAIFADDISVGGHVFLRRGFSSGGSISFKSSRIAGNFECIQGRITQRDRNVARYANDNALWLENATVEGHVLLSRDLHVDGCVNLLGIEIGGNLECDGSEFLNDTRISLLAERARIRGSVYLRHGFNALGCVHVLYADIGGDFDCTDARFSDTSNGALAADGAKVGGYARLTNVFAVGAVSFTSATFHSGLTCSGTFEAMGEEPALSFSSASIAGQVTLQNLHVKGTVELVSAKIGALSIRDARISGTVAALAADALSVVNSIQIGPNVALTGATRMHSAKISLHLVCTATSFTNNEGIAFLLDGLETGGHLSMDNTCSIVGAVQITAASIGTTLDIRANLHEASLNLSSTRATSFLDGPQAWPKRGGLVLDGFIYQRLLDQSSDVENRLRWFHHQQLPSRKQNSKVLRTQPYAQLAKVYRDQGNEDGARKVLISLQDDLLAHGQLAWQTRFGRWLLKITIAYGYKPLRALWFIAAFVLVGYFVFGWAFQLGTIASTDANAEKASNQSGTLSRTSESFCALAYAIDVFVPIIDLGQRAKWHPVIDKLDRDVPQVTQGSFICNGPPLPNGLNLPGWVVRVFRWLDIVAGWFFTSLFVAGITGLVRKS
jgi:cytoskeletal protein CcmA (bactofilin family)